MINSSFASHSRSVASCSSPYRFCRPSQCEKLREEGARAGGAGTVGSGKETKKKAAKKKKKKKNEKVRTCEGRMHKQLLLYDSL